MANNNPLVDAFATYCDLPESLTVLCARVDAMKNLARDFQAHGDSTSDIEIRAVAMNDAFERINEMLQRRRRHDTAGRHA